MSSAATPVSPSKQQVVTAGRSDDFEATQSIKAVAEISRSPARKPDVERQAGGVAAVSSEPLAAVDQQQVIPEESTVAARSTLPAPPRVDALLRTGGIHVDFHQAQRDPAWSILVSCVALNRAFKQWDAEQFHNAIPKGPLRREDRTNLPRPDLTSPVVHVIIGQVPDEHQEGHVVMALATRLRYTKWSSLKVEYCRAMEKNPNCRTRLFQVEFSGVQGPADYDDLLEALHGTLAYSAITEKFYVASNDTDIAGLKRCAKEREVTGRPTETRRAAAASFRDKRLWLFTCTAPENAEVDPLLNRPAWFQQHLHELANAAAAVPRDRRPAPKRSRHQDTFGLEPSFPEAQPGVAYYYPPHPTFEFMPPPFHMAPFQAYPTAPFPTPHRCGCGHVCHGTPAGAVFPVTAYDIAQGMTMPYFSSAATGSSTGGGCNFATASPPMYPRQW